MSELQILMDKVTATTELDELLAWVYEEYGSG